MALTNGGGSWRMVSQTAEYALRAVLYIARQSDEAIVPAGEISAALRVPDKYLSRVLNRLRRAGVLEGVRGSRGGFRLATPAAGLTLADVLGPFQPAAGQPPCLLRGQNCEVGGRCPAHEAWYGAAASAAEFFQRTLIADLVGRGIDHVAA